MHKGDIVIADHPERKTRDLKRFYGVVRDITKTGNVVIELADGSLIKRSGNSVAVYVQAPPNWRELYNRQEIAITRSKQPMLTNRSVKRRKN